MDLLSSNISGILFTGLGLALALLGFRMVKFHVQTLGIIALGAAGCAAGVLLGWPWAAATLAVVGALVGYRVGPLLYPVYVAIIAAAGGALLGFVFVLTVHASNPRLVVIASAIAFAGIALLHARILTIGWTSLIGGAIANLGVQSVFGVSRADAAANIVTTTVFFATGLVFQLLTNREEPAEPVLAAKVKPVPHRDGRLKTEDGLTTNS